MCPEKKNLAQILDETDFLQLAICSNEVGTVISISHVGLVKFIREEKLN